MITQIIKRDGRVIAYNEEKIAIAIYKAAAAVAKKDGKEPNLEMAHALAREVSENLEKVYQEKAPTVEQIQDEVIATLIRNRHVKTVNAYIIYRSERTKKRNETSSIIKAIRKITDFDTVQETANRESIKVDGNTAMGMMLQYGSVISKEYCKQYLLKPNFAVAHENGDIYIHDLVYMNMGTLASTQIDLTSLLASGFHTWHADLTPPQGIISAVDVALIVLHSNQNDQHGDQNIPLFDYALAKGVAQTFANCYRSNAVKALRFYGVNLQKANYLSEEEPTLIRSDKFVVAEREFLGSLATNLEIEKFQEIVYAETLADTRRVTFQALQAFILDLNTRHSRAGAQVPFSAVAVGTNTTAEGKMVTEQLLAAYEQGIGNGKTPLYPYIVFKLKKGINYATQDSNRDLFEIALRVAKKRPLHFAFLDASFNAAYYQEGQPETEVVYSNSRQRVIDNEIDTPQVLKRGNLSTTTINLVSLAIKHGVLLLGKCDMTGFYAELDETLALVEEQLLQRLDYQGKKKVHNFPFLMGQGVWHNSQDSTLDSRVDSVIKSGTLAIGFCGLAECLKALLGAHHGENNMVEKQAIEIVTHLADYVNSLRHKHHLNFVLVATNNDDVNQYFVQKDQKRFGNLIGITDKEKYSDSFMLPANFKVDLEQKIKLEAPFHALTNGGHEMIINVTLDMDLEKIIEQLLVAEVGLITFIPA